MKFLGPVLVLLTTFGLVAAGVLTGLGLAIGFTNGINIALPVELPQKRLPHLKPGKGLRQAVDQHGNETNKIPSGTRIRA